MPNDTTTTIDSFVIRFIRQRRQDVDGRAVHRGMIRHVQTDAEIAFTRWDEAVSFIQRFVPIELLIDAQEH